MINFWFWKTAIKYSLVENVILKLLFDGISLGLQFSLEHPYQRIILS
jgi:hypothetical protein